jgi:hypothetical protein
MKKKKPEFDVDFIQSKPLTAEQEKQLSEYIKKLKAKPQKSRSKKSA